MKNANFSIAAICLLIFAAMNVAYAAPSVVTTSGEHILINGKPAFIVGSFSICGAHGDYEPCSTSVSKNPDIKFDILNLKRAHEYMTNGKMATMRDAGVYVTLAYAFAGSWWTPGNTEIDRIWEYKANLEPNFLGYGLDEPNTLGQNLGQSTFKNLYTYVKTKDTNHPVMINLDYGSYKYGYGFNWYKDAADVLSWDFYPYWYDEPGPLGGASTATNNQPYAKADAFYAWEYGAYHGATGVSDFDAFGKPVLTILQAADNKAPSLQWLRAHTYLPIVIGVDGIEYWQYAANTYGLMSDTATNNYVQQLAREIKSIESYLLLPRTAYSWQYQKDHTSVSFSSNPTKSLLGETFDKLDYRLIKNPSTKKYLLIVVNKDSGAVTTSVTIQALAGVSTTTAKTIGLETTGSAKSGRTLTVTNGKFTDTFDGYAAHVYEISSGASVSDITSPYISITCPSPGTYSSQTISVSGTASDASGINKVEVKIGSGAWKTATGTTSWSISGVTLASGANTVYARATDTSGKTEETSIAVTYNPSAVAKPAIGNWGYGSFVSYQNHPELTWDIIILSSQLKYVRNGVNTAYYSSVIPLTDFHAEDVNYVKGRFDKATADKNLGWEYGAYLLNEEAFTPLLRSEIKLNAWRIDGTVTLAGVQIKGLKDWYISKYGSWDQAWWNSVTSAENRNDAKLKVWNEEYSYDVYKAWNLHMHSLGKKSAIMGFLTIKSTDFTALLNYYYTASVGKYILDNYDLILQYRYPTASGCSNWYCTSASSSTAQAIRQNGFKGKLGWMLTAEWNDGVGTPWSEAVAKDEFNKVAPYADIIFVRGFWNCQTAAKGCTSPSTYQYYPPYLIKFWEQYGGSSTSNPAPACTAPTTNPQPTITSLTLKPGWNQISSPLAAGIDIATIEAAGCIILPYKNQKLWAWNAAAQVWINPTKVEPFKGYWIYAAYQCNVPLSGTAATFTSLPLTVGWNKVSAQGTFLAIQGTCAGHITGNWVWNWDKTTEKWIHPTTMQLDKGYWIKVDQNCVLGA